jgi:exodeoxyribonuclease V alpha subunit
LTESALYQPLPAGLPARHQKPVIITSNNYDLGLYNGDTGIMSGTIGEEGAVVYFPTPESGEGVRRIATLRLPRYETAFALTVHKAQGSEFDKVMLILPDQMSEVLSRELLYTAVTRARKRIEIWGDEDVVRQVVERRTERNSGLRDRLWK